MVRLGCGAREYRIWFEKKLWDTRTIGAWSSYSGIDQINDDEILLADRQVTSPEGIEPVTTYSLTLDRTKMTIVESKSGLGETFMPRLPVVFKCTIAEKIDV